MASRNVQIAANIFLALGLSGVIFGLPPASFYDFFAWLRGSPPDMRPEPLKRRRRILNLVRRAFLIVAVLGGVGFLVVWLAYPGVRLCWSCEP